MAKVAPSVVRIETVGGLEQVGRVSGRHRADDRPGRVDGRLHRFQRVQFRAAAVVDPGDPAQRQAGGRRDRGPRPQPHAGAAEGRTRRDAARARSRAARRDGRRPVGDRRRAAPSKATSRTCRSACQRARTASGARRCRPTPRSRPTTTAARWWTSAAACWACWCRCRRSAGRSGRRRVVRLGHRLRRAAGRDPAAPGPLEEGEELQPGPAGRHAQRQRHVRRAGRDRRVPAQVARARRPACRPATGSSKSTGSRSPARCN